MGSSIATHDVDSSVGTLASSFANLGSEREQSAQMSVDIRNGKVDQPASERGTAFVVGPPRCGTTILGYLLGGAPGVTSLSEPFLAHAIYGPRRLRRFFRRLAVSASGPPPTVPTRSSPNEFLGFLQKLAAAQDKQYLLIKETYRQDQSWDNTRLLNWIADGSNPVAAVTRHPYDAAVSTLKFCRWWRGFVGRVARIWAPGLPLFRDDRELAEYFSHNWSGFVHWCRRRSLIPTRYEDLVSHPERELPRVCEACRIPFDARMLDHQRQRDSFGGIGSPEVIAGRPKPVNTKSIGRKNLLPPDLLEIVRKGCSDAAASLDYSMK